MVVGKLGKVMVRKKSEGYMYGGSDEGSYWCSKCKKAHHKISAVGLEHWEFKGRF